MPDQSPNPAPNDKPADDDPFAGLGMANIDELLAEAEALASDVAEEVGVEETVEEPATPTETAGATEDQADTPDDAVETIEAMIPDTSADAAETPGDIWEDFPETTEAGETTAVGMGNEPEAETAAGPVAVDASLASEAAALLDAVSAFGGTDADETPPGTEALGDEVAGDEPAFGGRLSALGRRVPAPVRRVGLTVVALPLSGLVGFCRVVDAPFSWMSPSLKSAIGYVAAVTAFMAIVTWGLVLTGITN
ncbi:MAG: hypothetical protein JXA69_02970 [Phycisphaerae bacterium]|nr:hypothetical protein [Phycisphaerae bacterium]